LPFDDISESVRSRMPQDLTSPWLLQSHKFWERMFKLV
jgi:hypothetical protein